MEGDFEGKESADDCETLLEKLRSQKRVCKMQLTKLYSRLLRLMSREVTDVEELLTALEATQEKMLDVLQVLEDLIVIYQSKGDEQSVKRAEAEMEKVTTDTDREIATVKEFLTSLTLKASSMSDAESQGDLLEEKAPKSNKTGGKSVGHVQKSSYRKCGPTASTGTSLLITNFQVEQKNGSLNWRLCRKFVFRDAFKNQNAKSPFPCKLSLTPQMKHMVQ